MARRQLTVAVVGGSGFIGRAIARRLAKTEQLKVRVLSRSPDRARERLREIEAEFVHADVTEPSTLKPALKGAAFVVDAVQFDGYPVEDPRRGLTFERVDLFGCLALLEAARSAGVDQFVYISGVSADEKSKHPAFRAKGQAEKAIRESGLGYTIFRPSLVFGQEDRVLNTIVKALRFSPVIVAPGSGQQKLQPVWVEDLAECVARALTSQEKALGRTFDVGGPEVVTFDQLLQLVMDITGYRRAIVHVPDSVLYFVGSIAEKLPRPLFSRDAATFVTTDSVCDVKPLVKALGIELTPLKKALAYLAAR